MSIKGRKKSTNGPGHDGKPKRGVFAGPTTEALAPHHGPSATTNATYGASHTGKPKAHVAVPQHNGFQPQPPGGLGHAQGAAPVHDGGMPTDRTHPFSVAPSPQLAHGKLAPVKDGMRNRNNDHLHAGASADLDCSTGDPLSELAHADPNHHAFRGRRFDCGD